MKYKLFILLICTSALIAAAPGLNSVTPTWASGTTTSDKNPGQVRVLRNGDMLQLTTGVNAGGDTNSSQSKTSTSSGNIVTTANTNNDASTSVKTASDSTILTNTRVLVPTGFADSIGQLINAVLTAVMVIAALLVFLYLIWGGIQWITSGGDKGKTQDARNKIIAALIGLIIVAASFAVLTLALQFLGFEDLNDVFDNTRSISTPKSSPTTSPSPSSSPSPSPTPQ